MSSEHTRAWLAMIEAKDVAGDVVEPTTARQMPLDVGLQPLDDLAPADRRLVRAEDTPIHFGEQIRHLVSGPAEHDAVDVLQVLLRLIERTDAAVDHNGELGMGRLEAVDAIIVKRRHIAVLLRREPLKPGFPRVDDECGATSCRDGRNESLKIGLAVLIVDADAALHSNRHLAGSLHGSHALGNQLRLCHKAGAKASLLHPVRRAANVKVDFVVAELGTYARCCRQPLRIGAAELQRDGMLLGAKTEQPFPIPANHGVRRNHLGVEQGVTRQQTMEEPAMPIRPIHHGGHGKFVSVMCVRDCHFSFEYAGGGSALLGDAH